MFKAMIFYISRYLAFSEVLKEEVGKDDKGKKGSLGFTSLSQYTTLCSAKSFQSCPTLRNPIDSSPPGSPVPGILQARTLEWVAISFSSA